MEVVPVLRQMPPHGGESGTSPARSSALPSANRVSWALAPISPLSDSRFLVVACPERRPDTQTTLPVRLRADQTVAKRFSFLAGLELGDDLVCLTVNDDEGLQGTELSGDPRHNSCAVCRPV